MSAAVSKKYLPTQFGAKTNPMINAMKSGSATRIPIPLDESEPGSSEFFSKIKANERAKRTDSIKERIENTLTRLRAAGFCNEDTLGEFAVRAGKLNGGYNIVKYELAMIEDYRGKASKEFTNRVYKRNKEMMWEKAITKFLIASCPESLRDPQADHYTSACRKGVKEIYVLASEVFGVYLWKEAAKQKETENQALAEKYEKKKRELKELKEKMRSLSNSSSKSQELEQELKNKAEAYDALYKKYIKLGRRERALENLLASQDEDGKAEATTGPKGAQEDGPENIGETSAKDSISDETTVQPLPEDSSVIVLGGHPNFLRKLKLAHPGWAYITTDSYSGRDGVTYAARKVSALIIAYNHLSHSLYETVDDAVADDVPRIYVKSINIDAVENEIKSQWAKAQNLEPGNR